MTAGPRLIALSVNEPVTRERVLTSLRQAGYYVQSYQPPSPAALISAARPDLIILDLHLVGSAYGWSFVGALREHALTARTPIIALMPETPGFEPYQVQLSFWNVRVVMEIDDVLPAVQQTFVATMSSGQS